MEEAKEVTAVFKQAFTLAPNGVTVICSNAEIGDTGTVGGMTYTKRTKDQITPANAEQTCTSGITNMSGMFQNGNFNGDLSSWDVSSVTDMNRMFSSAQAFDRDISSWEVSAVTSMASMFQNASDFNQDLSGWCVSNIMTQPSNFAKNSALTNSNQPHWGSCPQP